MHLFVTGTDTEVGKTLVSTALLHLCRARGLRSVGMKPVAAGCDEDGTNSDVTSIIAASDVAVARELVNPYLFRPPIAPHIAATEAGMTIDIEHIAACYQQLCLKAQAVIVEGVGGFLVPLGENVDGGNLATRLNLPVVLVVSMRLGCLNHALLTCEAIAARGLTLAGWVANKPAAEMQRSAENLQALRERIAAPLLGAIPFLDQPDAAAAAGRLALPAA
jgi:dethiobiotin synthetase